MISNQKPENTNYNNADLSQMFCLFLGELQPRSQFIHFLSSRRGVL